MRPMPMMPSRLPPMRWPSIQVGDQPGQFLPSVRMEAPSIRRRGTARISAMVMSAVSSVRTFGVLVTVMPRASAAATSILSTPLPKLAISFNLQSGCLRISSVISSVTVGTSTSAERTASAICSGVKGVSSRLSRASNSSRMRVSIESGSLRVTTTRGFFLTDMSCSREIVQTSLTRLFDTAVAAWSRRLLLGFLGFPDISLGFPRGTFGLVLFPRVPSSLAEGRAKTRTRNGQAEGQSGRGTGGYGVGWCFNSQNLSCYPGRRRVDGVEAFLFCRGARGCVAGRVGKHRIFGKGFGRHRQRFAGAALCQPQIRPCERQGGSDQGQRSRLGLPPLGPAGGNHRRIRELAQGQGFRGRRGLGLSLAAVGSPHRRHHHEDQGRTRAAL